MRTKNMCLFELNQRFRIENCGQDPIAIASSLAWKSAILQTGILQNPKENASVSLLHMDLLMSIQEFIEDGRNVYGN